jgi:glucose-6-phosphate 1-dehydrogenase
MRVAQSDALVLFGVTGDLAHKMVFPGLYALAKRGELKQCRSSALRDSKWTA